MKPFFLERLRDFKYSVPPPGGIWLIMIILAQYLDSNLVPPPHRNSSQVPPPDWKKPCIFNQEKVYWGRKSSLSGNFHVLIHTFEFPCSLHILFLFSGATSRLSRLNLSASGDTLHFSKNLFHKITYLGIWWPGIFPGIMQLIWQAQNRQLSAFITNLFRVAEVVRKHEGPSPKSLDMDESFKP